MRLNTLLECSGKKNSQDPKDNFFIIVHLHFRFVKRINEAWSSDSPMVVHCSAGVGRSGTLIAIDSLMQELEEEKEVKIFQTICGLRHHRNYLVQSVVRMTHITYSYFLFRELYY